MKKMSCGELRDRLTRNADARRDPSHERHLEQCAACRTYAERLGTARQLLRAHHANLEPDASFNSRVIARLPNSPTEALGWAAVRFLPATLALALVLVWFTLQATPQPTEAADVTLAPTEDLLSWVIDPGGDER